MKQKDASNNRSKIDELSGRHTTNFLVAILFIFTIICLTILLCIKSNIKENLITGLIGILGMLAGFFAGNAAKKI